MDARMAAAARSCAVRALEGAARHHDWLTATLQRVLDSKALEHAGRMYPNKDFHALISYNIKQYLEYFALNLRICGRVCSAAVPTDRRQAAPAWEGGALKEWAWMRAYMKTN
eukprot:scaffold1117_cov379-Prasinococcus_capsulatus_cf.AAC.18